MLSGMSMFLPLTIVLTVTSREANPPLPCGVELSGGRAALRQLVGAESTPEVLPERQTGFSCGLVERRRLRQRDAGRPSPLAGDGHGRHADRASLEERLGAGSEGR